MGENREDLSSDRQQVNLDHKSNELRVNTRYDIPYKSGESFNFKSKEFNDTNLLNEINLSDLPSANAKVNRMSKGSDDMMNAG